MDGGFFDFNGDGHPNAGEAAFVGMLGTQFAKQAARVTEEAERQANEAPWKQSDDPDDANDRDDDGTTISIYDDDPLDLFEDDDEDYDIYDEDFYDLDENEIDTSSRSAIMRAFNGGTYFEDLDYLVEEATNRGVRFTPENIIDLSYELWDEDLLVQLIAHSKSRFLQKYADELAPRWGSVLLEYQEEAFDEEDFDAEDDDGRTCHGNMLEYMQEKPPQHQLPLSPLDAKANMSAQKFVSVQRVGSSKKAPSQQSQSSRYHTCILLITLRYYH